MNRRLASYKLAHLHGLTPEQVRDLQALQEQPPDPHAEARGLARAVAVTAAALVGLGVMLWIAANWPALGRTAKFALLQSVVAVMAAGAIWRPAARIPLLLIAFLVQGAVLAFFGQTYQTGADPWLLFALWALLALPWCLASRSEVLWAPWTLVGMAAASLWIHAHQGWRWVPDRASITVHLVGWLAALALAASSFPWAALRRRLGTGPWSFRTGVTLAAAMLVASGLIALFGRHVAPTYGLALLLLLAAALALALPRVHDVFALSVMGLSIDTLLVGGLARWLFKNSRGDAVGPLFVLGIIAALLAAATVAIVTRLARRSGASVTAEGLPGVKAGDDEQAPTQRWLAAAIARGLLPEAAAQDLFPRASRPWPVVLLGFLGAQLAAWPLIAFVAALFGQALLEGASAYLVAVLLVAGACVVLRGRVAWPLFVGHLALTALLAGLGVLCYRLMRDLGDTAGGLSSAALMLGIGLILPMAWVRAMLGASAACTAWLALTQPGLLGRGMHSFWNASAGLAFAWVAGLAMQKRIAIEAGRWPCASAFEATLGGWLVATLAVLALSSGMSFLVGGVIGADASAGVDIAIGRAQRSSPASWTSWLSGPAALSLACLLAAWAWCASLSGDRRSLLRGPLGLALLLATALLAVFMPALGLVAALGLLAWTTSRPWQASLACLAAAWIIGAFYYALAWTLETKALVLLLAGAALGAVAWLARRPRREPEREPGRLPALRGGLAWTASGLLATLAMVNLGIWQKEEIIARGRPVYIELAPVDPRSLMQGDYMALNYRMSEDLRQQLDGASTLGRPRVAASLDERGVARLDRLAASEAPAGKLVVELTPRNGRWVVASDAWFFREGDGQRFQRARYGEFRVDRRGRALLVGLADAQLKRIDP